MEIGPVYLSCVILGFCFSGMAISLRKCDAWKELFCLGVLLMFLGFYLAAHFPPEGITIASSR